MGNLFPQTFRFKTPRQMAIDLIMEEEEFWKCRKHPSQPRSGVCPSCLRDRLLLLCPDCSSLRPCPCPCLPSSSSSSSSSSSLSSRFLSDPPRSSCVGSVGRVSSLIEIEPAFRRSRSAAFSFLRPMVEDHNNTYDRSEEKRIRRFRNFWGILKGNRMDAGRLSSGIGQDRLDRSRSVGVGDGGLKAKKWSFPSPMRVFQLKKPARVVHERSPMCRG